MAVSAANALAASGKGTLFGCNWSGVTTSPPGSGRRSWRELYPRSDAGAARRRGPSEQLLDHLLALVHDPHRPAVAGVELLLVVDPQRLAHRRHEVDRA